MSIQEGVTYTFKSIIAPSSVIDLSKADDRTIALWSSNEGDNQKWVAHENLESDWSFKNVYNGSFLGIQGPAAPGAQLIGVQAPVYFTYHNNPSDPKDVISLSAAADKALFVQVLDGIAEDGNKLEIQPSKSGDARDIQLWKAQRV